MSGGESTRKNERLEIFGEMLGEVMVYEPMAVRVISRGGALIETSCPLVVDSLHDFRLMLGNISVVVKGRIVHSHVSELEQGGVIYRVGIEFVQPTDHVLEAITQFMAAIVAGREIT